MSEDRIEIDGQVSVGYVPPTRAGLDRLREAGFRSVIDLRMADEGGLLQLSPAQEGEAAKEAGLAHAHLPTPADRLEPAQLDRFAATLEQLPAPAFVHCASGKRAGSLVLAWKARRAGHPGAVALAQAERLGVTLGSLAARRALQAWVDGARAA